MQNFVGGKNSGKGKVVRLNVKVQDARVAQLGQPKLVNAQVMAKVGTQLFIGNMSITNDHLARERISRLLILDDRIQFVAEGAIAYSYWFQRPEKYVEQITQICQKIIDYFENERRVLVMGTRGHVSNVVALVLMRNSGDDLHAVINYLQSKTSTLFKKEDINEHLLELIKKMNYKLDVLNKMYRNYVLNIMTISENDQIDAIYGGIRRFFDYMLIIEQRQQEQLDKKITFYCRYCNAYLFHFVQLCMVSFKNANCIFGQKKLTVEPIQEFVDSFLQAPFEGERIVQCYECERMIGNARSNRIAQVCPCEAHVGLQLHNFILIDETKVKPSNENIFKTIYKKLFS